MALWFARQTLCRGLRLRAPTGPLSCVLGRDIALSYMVPFIMQIGTGEFNGGSKYVVDLHLIHGEVEIFLAASWEGIRVKLEVYVYFTSFLCIYISWTSIFIDYYLGRPLHRQTSSQTLISRRLAPSWPCTVLKFHIWYMNCMHSLRSSNAYHPYQTTWHRPGQRLIHMLHTDCLSMVCFPLSQRLHRGHVHCF